MLFNSIEFALFLPIVFVLYWFGTNRNLKLQNILLLLASYLFYGWWDWRFLLLIMFSSFVDFFIGLNLEKTSDQFKRKALLFISIGVNLGFLGFFKYYNFFAQSFSDAFILFGNNFEVAQLKIILPVGISFYTFQTLSYSFDVYNRKIEPSRDLIAFFAFVSFFPQLVAGPIERASNLLPQFLREREFKLQQAVDGMRQILWGLFKKVVIADNCAVLANEAFNADGLSGSTLLLGAFFFAFQIYGDFSGYSDIAIGTARLFGFDLKKNFAFPYFSRDIAEFWRRWHISLSRWFRDYLYIPLGGSRGGTWMKVRNTFIIFVVSGFWHGANWTFLVWGFLNAVYFLPLLLGGVNRKNTNNVAEGKILPSIKEVFQMGTTFLLTVLAWIFFRADSVGKAFLYLQEIFSMSLFSMPEYSLKKMFTCLGLVGIFVLVEWLQREKEHGLEISGMFNKPIRWGMYYLIIFILIVFGGNQQEFIYFQF